jgi:hypothetical protein
VTVCATHAAESAAPAERGRGAHLVFAQLLVCLLQLLTLLHEQGVAALQRLVLVLYKLKALGLGTCNSRHVRQTTNRVRDKEAHKETLRACRHVYERVRLLPI